MSSPFGQVYPESKWRQSCPGAISWKPVGLITRRSQVQILPPPPTKPASEDPESLGIPGLLT